MNLHSSLLKIRSRIHKIIDEQLGSISQKLQTQQNMQKLSKMNLQPKEPMINQSKLEDWVQMFRNEILILEEKKIKVNRRQKNNQQTQMQNLQINLTYPRPSLQNFKQNEQILWTIDGQKLNIFSLKETNQKKNLIPSWQCRTFQLQPKIIKPFTSTTYCHQLNSLIMIGGSKPGNQNIKSSKIYQLNLKTSKISHINNLPYGLSSHTAVYNNQLSQIYVVGGNKNHSIVTRGCFRVKLKQNIVEEIACLNYPAASASCVMWKKRWIYKFGGVGQAFGGWDVSPYIQRYNILEDEWEVVNPSMALEGNLRLNFSDILHTNSSLYVCQDQDKIFVFGGFSIDGKFNKKAFVLQLHQSKQQSDDQSAAQNNVEHVIRHYGNFDCDQQLLNGFVFYPHYKKEISMFGFKMSNKGEELVFPSLIHKFSEKQLK